MRGMIREALLQSKTAFEKHAGAMEEIPSEVWAALLQDFVVLLDAELRKGLTPMQLRTVSMVITTLALRLEGVAANDTE